MKKFKLLFLCAFLSAGIMGNLDASNKPRKAYTTNEEGGYTAEYMQNAITNFVFTKDSAQYKITEYLNEERVKKQLNKIVNRKSRTGIDVKRGLKGLDDKLAQNTAITRMTPGLFIEDVKFQNQETEKCHPGRIRVHGKKNTMTPKIEVMGFINTNVICGSEAEEQNQKTQNKFHKRSRSRSSSKDSVKTSQTEIEMRKMDRIKDIWEDKIDDLHAPLLDDSDEFDAPTKANTKKTVKKNSEKSNKTAQQKRQQKQKQKQQKQKTANLNIPDEEFDDADYYTDSDDKSEDVVKKGRKNSKEFSKNAKKSSVAKEEFNANYVINKIQEDGLTVNDGEFDVVDKRDAIEDVVNKLFKRKNRSWCKKLDDGKMDDKAAKENIKLKRGVFRIKMNYTQNGVVHDGILRINGISNGKSYGETGSGITYQYFIGEEKYTEWPKEKNIQVKSIALPENLDTENDSVVEAKVGEIYGYLCRSNPFLNRVLTLNDDAKHAVLDKIREKLKEGIYRWIKFPMLAQNAVLKKTHDGRMVIGDDKIPVVKFGKIGAGQDVVELSFEDKNNGDKKYIYMHFKTVSGFKTGSGLKEKLANKKAGKILQITLTKNKNYTQGPVEEDNEIEGQE